MSCSSRYCCRTSGESEELEDERCLDVPANAKVCPPAIVPNGTIFIILSFRRGINRISSFSAGEPDAQGLSLPPPTGISLPAVNSLTTRGTAAAPAYQPAPDPQASPPSTPSACAPHRATPDPGDANAPAAPVILAVPLPLSLVPPHGRRQRLSSAFPASRRSCAAGTSHGLHGLPGQRTAPHIGALLSVASQESLARSAKSMALSLWNLWLAAQEHPPQG